MPVGAAPGLTFEVAPPPEEPTALRSDVAGFLGGARRGPVGEAVRVEEWRDFVRVFGGLDAGCETPYAVRSYFENGGRVAWMVRVAGAGVQTAAAAWEGPDLPAHRVPPAPQPAESEAFEFDGQAPKSLVVTAASPGEWANDARVRIDYRRRGSFDRAEVDVETRAPGEAREVLRALPATQAAVAPLDAPLDPEGGDLRSALAARSRLVRAVPDLAGLAPLPVVPGPNRLHWELRLAGGADDPPGPPDYFAALELLGRRREVALVALPDLFRHLPFDFAAGDPAGEASFAVLHAALADAERRQDRLVLVDLPWDPAEPNRTLAVDQIARLLAALRSLLEPGQLRAAALYHPRIWVADPLGGSVAPQRPIPASGPVAGLVSRLDRERGAHHTPANAPLFDALDARGGFTGTESGRLNDLGVNLVRCFPNRGLTVWGGRTLDLSRQGRYVAHRRLVHRLVRAIRRVAEPLVFEVNGPELWLTFVRAITSVLLEAFRAGALRGATPDEAFRVRCDEETNPPEERDRGRVVCEIQLAPAVPMEFITLRVALAREGELEVFES